MIVYETTDKDIRLALHAKRLQRAKACPDTLVIDELGLAHARGRIDIAVINGCIHGYEIKSFKDTLDRLPTQMEIYRKTLQKLTIVAAPRHISGILSGVPKWCGLIVAERGARGGIKFQILRNAVVNTDTDRVMIAHLLWRDEVISLLSQAGYAPKDLRRPRQQLYAMLCETHTTNEITTAIRLFMAKRRAWRDHQAHV